MPSVIYGQVRVLETRISHAETQISALSEHLHNALQGSTEFDKGFILQQTQNLIEKVVEIQREAMHVTPTDTE